MSYRNSEHYADPTAGRALANIAWEERRAGRKGRNRGRGTESRGRRGRRITRAPEPTEKALSAQADEKKSQRGGMG